MHKLKLTLTFAAVILTAATLYLEPTVVTGKVPDMAVQAPPIAGVDHVIWVWFENRDVSEINAQTAPFFTSFAAANANFTNYFGVQHPSQPNYLDAFSGSNQGINDDLH